MKRPAPSDPDSWRFIYGQWHGRLSRRSFWLHGVCILLGLSVLGHALLGIAGVRAARAEVIVNLLLLYPALAVSAKRWQDRDRSPWWVLIGLVPLAGWVWLLLDNGLVRGSRSHNRFGDPPAR